MKKYENVYSGFLECGDCGSPMFSMSQADIKAAYTGLAGCTSHHIRVDVLEELYDALEGELMQKIKNLNHQIEMLSDKRNTIILVNRSAKTTMDVFRDILAKNPWTATI